MRGGPRQKRDVVAERPLVELAGVSRNPRNVYSGPMLRSNVFDAVEVKTGTTST